MLITIGTRLLKKLRGHSVVERGGGLKFPNEDVFLHDGLFLLLLPPFISGASTCLFEDRPTVLGLWGCQPKSDLLALRTVLKLAKELDTPVEKFPISLLLKPRCCLSTLSPSPLPPRYQSAPVFLPV